jgi:hypothetical protein
MSDLATDNAAYAVHGCSPASACTTANEADGMYGCGDGAAWLIANEADDVMIEAYTKSYGKLQPIDCSRESGWPLAKVDSVCV